MASRAQAAHLGVDGGRGRNGVLLQAGGIVQRAPAIGLVQRRRDAGERPQRRKVLKVRREHHLAGEEERLLACRGRLHACPLSYTSCICANA